MQEEQQSTQADETQRTHPFEEPRITAEGSLEFGNNHISAAGD